MNTLTPRQIRLIDRVAEAKTYAMILAGGPEDGGGRFDIHRASLERTVASARESFAAELPEIYPALARRIEDPSYRPNITIPHPYGPLWVQILVGVKLLALLGDGPAPCAVCDMPTVFRATRDGHPTPECRRCRGLHTRRTP